MKADSLSHRTHIVARRATSRDKAVLQRWYTDPRTIELMEDEPQSPAELRRKIADLVECDPVRDGACILVFEIGGHPVAMAHFVRMNWTSRTAEISVMLSPEEPGTPLRGYSVICRLAQVAFNTFNLNKIYAFVYAHNLRSFRILTRVMKVEAVLKGYLKRADRFEDVYLIGILASEYRSLPSRHL